MAVCEHFEQYLKEHLKITISEITYFEVLAGLSYKQATRQIDEFDKFVSSCNIVKLSNQSLKDSATVYADLRNQGITIGTADILIAGIAISNNLTLVTNNQKHYQPILNLRISNWNP